MLKHTLAPAIVIALAMPLVACERLVLPPREATLSVAQTTTLDSIPLEYGELVAITPAPEYITVLWFEKPDKTLVAVRVGYARGTMNPDILSIPRN